MQVEEEERVVVLGTGGTIAGSASSAADHVGYKAGQVPVQQLLTGIPALAHVSLVAEQVAQVDSKDMGPAVWLPLARRCQHWLAQPQVTGVVVTHGTDTLEETAYFLHRVLAPAKPLVLTCAMRPATALSADGPQNIADAIAVVRTAGARGVVAVCAGRVHAGVDVRKVHPYRLDAFSSGDAGVLGHVEDGRLRQLRDWPAQGEVALPVEALDTRHEWPHVEIVLSHSGASGRAVEALVRDGVQGLVVAGTGNGSVHAALESALVAAMKQGVQVLRTTRCAEGEVVGRDADPLPKTTLTPVQARIELQLRSLAR
ncbi:asparaginase [Ramlibacter sp. MMS24-I3-19]|uniref:asparaginase n=1 Tax=Ramlibacter sp. MMS24-I3-19 TaxID=3416606 RepID=UPI003CFC3FC7